MMAMQRKELKAGKKIIYVDLVYMSLQILRKPSYVSEAII